MSNTSPNSIKQTNRAALERYDLAAFDLIPLHKYDATSRKHGRDRKDGKRPLHYNWTVRKYFSKDVLKTAIAENSNVGVRLKPNQLVIDVDPRNGGEQGFIDLCKDLDLNPAEWPRVETGSGGSHFYLTIPQNIPIVDTLPDYKGVEFKSRGRQVVAAGSIHPDTKKHYVWDETHPDLDPATHNGHDAPPCPKKLLVAIRRPQRSTVTNGGQYTQAQAARALAGIDATKFQDHKAWLDLMMAVHHATNGDARSEFVEWSCSDPKFAQDAELIGRRWDSLHANKEGGVTYKTFEKAIREHGDPNTLVARDDAAEDFADDTDFDTPPVEQDFDFDTPATDEDDGVKPEREAPSRLIELNERYVGVFGYGRYRIMFREKHAGGERWAAANKADFLSRFENESLQDGSKTISLGKAWQEWLGRKTADGTTFDTRAKPAAITNSGALNLWTGFRCEPVDNPDGCKLFMQMIRDDICAGNDEAYRYVLQWIAWKFQNPGKLPETAIALIGEKGTGKTTLGETIVNLFGEHGMAVDSVEKIAGKFNGHLETKCFVYADEAVWGGDKINEGALKKLITDSEVSYEYKGVQTFTGVNHVGLMFAGNAAWIVPASMDERRFCVLKVSSQHRAPDDAGEDHPNRRYWNAIHRELASGGRAAFLHVMLTMKLGDWHPRQSVPRTEALGEQKYLGLSGAPKFYLECLQEGSLPADTTKSDDGDWEEQPLQVNPTKMTTAYRSWTHGFNRHANVSTRGLWEELKKFGWKKGRTTDKTRERFWLAPQLGKARQAFAAKLGHDPFN